MTRDFQRKIETLILYSRLIFAYEIFYWGNRQKHFGSMCCGGLWKRYTSRVLPNAFDRTNITINGQFIHPFTRLNPVQIYTNGWPEGIFFCLFETNVNCISFTVMPIKEPTWKMYVLANAHDQKAALVG